MVKTEWICDDCGQKFNSRSARLYHRNHTCKAEGKVITPDEPPEEKTEIDLDEQPQQTDIKENKKTYEKESGEIIPDGAPDSSENKKIKGDDIPWIIIFPVIVIIGLCAGILVFWDKIYEIFKGKPPAGEVAA